MAKNRITDLRDHLFETLEALKDTDKPMDLDRAKTICDVAQTIINTAKVEVDLVRAVGGSAPGNGFFCLPEETRVLPKIPRSEERTQLPAGSPAQDRLPPGGVGGMRHNGHP